MRADLMAAAQRFRFAEQPQSGWSVTYPIARLTGAITTEAALHPTALNIQLDRAARTAGLKPMALNIGGELDLAIKAYLDGPPEPKRACLASVLAQVRPKYIGADTTRRLKAWAQGDLPNALGVIGCVEEKVGLYKVVAKATTPALKEMMAQGGKSVAAVELIPLLMKGGVIEALKADGYTVEGPDLDRGGS